MDAFDARPTSYESLLSTIEPVTVHGDGVLVGVEVEVLVAVSVGVFVEVPVGVMVGVSLGV